MKRKLQSMKTGKGRARFAALLLLIVLAAALLLVGCGATKTLHCDRCGREVRVSADSNMDEDWILYCRDCEKALGLDKLIEKD